MTGQNLYNVKVALQNAAESIDMLRVSEGVPCPKACGDCSSAENGCWILRARDGAKCAVDTVNMWQRDYAVLRYTLEQIKRMVSSENYSDDDGVDPVDIQDMAKDALSITNDCKMPFATDASIRRYIHEKLEQKKESK